MLQYINSTTNWINSQQTQNDYLMNMSNLTGSESNNITTCCQDHPFSDDLIVWLQNETLYEDINLPCMIYLIILAVLGIFGNGLVIYIYGFRFKRTNAHFFILSLAVFDTMCCFAMIMEVFDKRFPMYSGNYKIICKITRLTEVFATVSSSLLLLCIALDRYYKICRPFKSFSYRKARISLIICITVGVVLAWPMVLFHGPETIETGVKNVVGLDCGDDDNFKDSILPTVYFGFLGALNVIVIFLLAFMYIRIFLAILKWKREQIGENIPSSPVSVVSMNYKISRVMSWVKRSKKKRNDETSKESYQGNFQISTSDHQIESKKNSSDQNGYAVQNGVNGINHTNFLHKHGSITANRRPSTFSVSSGRRKSFKNSKTVTTNTVLFSIVTIIYIISYLPTIIVETLNARGVYIEEDLPHTTRRILVIMNVTYFLNNVCNQYVYSAINPAFRQQVKQIFTGP